ncbi:MAG: nucleoside 2-deoxyribosyltransferase [Sphingomonadaceae bacterium]
MTQIRKVYLGGPEVFLPDALAVVTQKATLCTQYGFEAAIPSDNGGNHSSDWSHYTPTQIARAIYQANVDTMKSVDFGIFDLTPFRGVSADAGTIFEVGLMVGMGKPVFGYTNIAGDYIDRFGVKQAAPDANPMIAWVDDRGWRIENFGGADNLMIDSAIALNGADMVRMSAPLPDLFHYMEAFKGALGEAKAYFTAK